MEKMMFCRTTAAFGLLARKQSGRWMLFLASVALMEQAFGDQWIINSDGSYAGRVYEDGRVIDASGNYSGSINGEWIINKDGSYGGRVYEDGRIVRNGKKRDDSRYGSDGQDGWSTDQPASPDSYSEYEPRRPSQPRSQATSPTLSPRREAAFLDEVTAKMHEEAERLEALIPRAEFASDLAKLYLNHPFGCGAEDIRDLWDSRWKQLVELGRISPPTSRLTMTDLQKMLEQGDAKCAEVARKIDKAAAALGKTREALSR